MGTVSLQEFQSHGLCLEVYVEVGLLESRQSIHRTIVERNVDINELEPIRFLRLSELCNLR